MLIVTEAIIILFILVGTTEADRRKDHIDRLYWSALDASSVLCGRRAFEVVKEDENSMYRKPYSGAFHSLKVH